MRPQDNLEQLFRKRYENLETIPREDLWAGIAARLPEKENKKRIIPLWYQLAGVAAVLSLLALVGYNYFYSTSSPATKVVYFDIPQENRKVNITSEEFEQNMFESGELLNYLRLNTLVRQNNQQVSSSSSSSSSSSEGYKYVAKSNTESIGQKENPSALTSDYQENEIGELSQEQLLLSEKPEVPLHPETEVANLEGDLKDLRLEAQKEESIEDLNSKAAGEKRFQFRTTAAAVYFDNLGKGSPIDDQLAKQ
ncbi:hypothetical protein LZ575_09170 [Antarcticibacterium sp. 1MA-6-2]|uniref:hypothetical protein n=1 Tax=Antarcticibacterium sp. 1MA-6-2 TaxID=2908210 RepID=UPI001F29058C|nr:hypothetical protein [Antarcticibacterium sp. 1MA-6-2]UJH92618.1 hypothetical protein LZ575_09170 [Antarcticibacterium sp. 1MA-6-2]